MSEYSHIVFKGAIKDFNLPDRVSGALKILPDISKIYRTFPKSWHIYLVAYNFFMNHPCDIIQTLNNINIWFKKRQFITCINITQLTWISITLNLTNTFILTLTLLTTLLSHTFTLILTRTIIKINKTSAPLHIATKVGSLSMTF